MFFFSITLSSLPLNSFKLLTFCKRSCRVVLPLHKELSSCLCSASVLWFHTSSCIRRDCGQSIPHVPSCCISTEEEARVLGKAFTCPFLSEKVTFLTPGFFKFPTTSFTLTLPFYYLLQFIVDFWDLSLLSSQLWMWFLFVCVEIEQEEFGIMAIVTIKTIF